MIESGTIAFDGSPEEYQREIQNRYTRLVDMRDTIQQDINEMEMDELSKDTLTKSITKKFNKLIDALEYASLQEKAKRQSQLDDFDRRFEHLGDIWEREVAEYKKREDEKEISERRELFAEFFKDVLPTPTDRPSVLQIALPDLDIRAVEDDEKRPMTSRQKGLRITRFESEPTRASDEALQALIAHIKKQEQGSQILENGHVAKELRSWQKETATAKLLPTPPAPEFTRALINQHTKRILEIIKREFNIDLG